jgi:hypothetical protein
MVSQARREEEIHLELLRRIQHKDPTKFELVSFLNISHPLLLISASSALSMYLQCSLAVYYAYTVHIASTTDSLFLWHGCLYEGMFVSCYSSTCMPAA